MTTFNRNGNGEDKPPRQRNSSKRVISLDEVRRGRRGPSEDLFKDLQNEARQEVDADLERLAPPRIFEPRCHVCNHPYRDFIEAMLFRGIGYKTISDRVNPTVHRHSLKTHWEKHMDLRESVLRRVIEQEAELQGKNFRDGLEDAVTKRGVLEVALRKGYEAIIDNITTVEPRDLIQIAKVLAEMDSQSASAAVDEARASVSIFLHAIQDICDQETLDAIGVRVKQLRQREGITTAIEAQTQPVIEAHVVE